MANENSAGLDVVQRIKDIYAEEQKNRPVARTAEDIPVSYESITPEWLTAVICAKAAGAKVVSHRLDEADSGTSNRRRIFLDYNKAGEDAGLPRTVFCKATHDLVNRLILSNGGTRSEVIFFTKVRPRMDFDAPRPILARYDPKSFASIIMLEDMAGEVEFCAFDTPVTKEMSQSQLALLAKLHGRFHESPEFSGALSDVLTWQGRFQSLVDRYAFFECCTEGFAAAEAVIPPQLFARAAKIWPATLRSVERHSHLPHTLNHGDVHLKNWYIRKSPAMGLSDWQVLNRGHWGRDLAYVISTALSVEDRRRWEKDLIHFYLEKQREAGAPPVSFDTAWLYYRQQLFGALAFWTQTMAPNADMPEMQPKPATLEFIGRITQAIQDHDSLNSFD